ncbi:hypothetical protein [Streptomyces scabiei]|uniref:hypothetical protein n=1 Tax=Streptomyces scabiei TaxID=1930 RepID=UPI00131E96EC|nr:hypothetical protein [Streptomyces scabiei]
MRRLLAGGRATHPHTPVDGGTPRASSPGGLVHRYAAGASSAALPTAGLRSPPESHRRGHADTGNSQRLRPQYDDQVVTLDMDADTPVVAS